MKDHEKRELVNELTKVAKLYGGEHQSLLRDKIAEALEFLWEPRVVETQGSSVDNLLLKIEKSLRALATSPNLNSTINQALKELLAEPANKAHYILVDGLGKITWCEDSEYEPDDLNLYVYKISPEGSVRVIKTTTQGIQHSVDLTEFKTSYERRGSIGSREVILVDGCGNIGWYTKTGSALETLLLTLLTQVLLSKGAELHLVLLGPFVPIEVTKNLDIIAYRGRYPEVFITPMSKEPMVYEFRGTKGAKTFCINLTIPDKN